MLLLAFWAPSAAFGHDSGIVSGQVTDGRTGAPLAAVHVGLVGTELSARTGQDGRFSIPNVRPGHYELRATLIGYGAGTALVSVQPGQTAMTNIRLTTPALGLQAITARAHGNDEAHRDGTDVPGIGETTAGLDDPL